MFYSNNTAQIDIHGMTVDMARIELTKLLSRLNDNIKQVKIIHGYRGGQALMNLVRYEFRHPRLIDIKYTDNYGETLYILE